MSDDPTSFIIFTAFLAALAVAAFAAFIATEDWFRSFKGAASAAADAAALNAQMAELDWRRKDAATLPEEPPESRWARWIDSLYGKHLEANPPSEAYRIELTPNGR